MTSIIGDLDAMMYGLVMEGPPPDTEAKLAKMLELRQETLKRSGREDEAETDPREPNPGAPGQMDPPVTVVLPNPGWEHFVYPPEEGAAPPEEVVPPDPPPEGAAQENGTRPPLHRGVK